MQTYEKRCANAQLLLANGHNLWYLPGGISQVSGQTLTGTVTDESQESLPVVNVVVKGTITGTVTDMDGRYSLNVPNEDAILVFSSIGYITQEVPVNGRSEINMTLAGDVKSLEEVVVVGYGTQRRSDVTGSIASVGSEELEKVMTHSFTNSIQGRVPGVQITGTSGGPIIKKV